MTNKEKVTQIMKIWYQFVQEVTKGYPERLVANHIWLWTTYLRAHLPQVIK